MRVKIDLQLNEDDGHVFVDKEAVVLALSEVLINAIEAIKGDGAVQVTLGSELITKPEKYNKHALPGTFSVITVLDNGVGISLESLGHIFEPFYSTKENENVLGLGLTVAFGVMQHNNGWIDISPRANGTCVKIFLPNVVAH